MAASDLSAFLVALGLAGAALAGCASASFGVSAKAAPETRNIDSVSAASFFISSLFGAEFDLVPKRMRTTSRLKAKAGRSRKNGVRLVSRLFAGRRKNRVIRNLQRAASPRHREEEPSSVPRWYRRGRFGSSDIGISRQCR